MLGKAFADCRRMNLLVLPFNNNQLAASPYKPLFIHSILETQPRIISTLLIPLGRLLNIVMFVGFGILGTIVFVTGPLRRPLGCLLCFVGRLVLLMLHVVAVLQMIGQFLFRLQAAIDKVEGHQQNGVGNQKGDFGFLKNKRGEM